ncbi:hypothetical protein TrVE_jg3984 [Triparma verrucosa]|uniref:Trafficking protein particle complex subunit n=2 Tax=Triparma TaxID=722752 RepID=A0A9W7DPR5_9STRA|nr:hypothetical protein TrST_g11000 [Triparma strigata]GMH85906.1 hypothetical protein TrVE_jg3984 [Triparma verrucosa]
MLQSSSPRTSHPLDLPLPRRPGEVSLSAFTLLFSELVQLHQTSASSVSDFESLLSKSGWEVGSRTYLMSSQVQGGKNREIRVLGVLQFLSSTIWTSLFNKKADSLEKSLNSSSEYMIHDSNPLPTIFCEVPSSLSSFNPASFVSGIVKGALETAGFGCEVTAHRVDEGEGNRTVFLVNFCREVMEREEAFV